MLAGDRSRFMEEVQGLQRGFPPHAAPVELLRECFARLARVSPCIEDCWDARKAMNNRMLDLQSILKVRVRMASRSFRAALRVALAGTRVDFLHADLDDILATIDELMSTSLPVDHGAALRARMRRGANILYIAGEAGEVVLDRMFIRSIPLSNITCVVASTYGGLVASGQDADYVGMRQSCHVLASGCGGPGVLLHHASERLRELYREADLIIAKGELQLESLFPVHDERLFCLFTCRCEAVAETFGIALGDTVVLSPTLRLRELRG
ncbi:MAG: hypothetical protein CSA07_01160 [Bacteroidia bacterium]|nr:MAG: hypothetical protein CSA07_01160 [Bacteroidia bacterium]